MTPEQRNWAAPERRPPEEQRHRFQVHLGDRHRKRRRFDGVTAFCIGVVIGFILAKLVFR